MDEFSRLSLLLGTENVKKLNDITVLVVGLGGVGGYAVEALARSGIGHLILVDKDTVEITNFNRQIIATKENIGCKKTEAWKKRIASITTTCKVEEISLFVREENVETLFQKKIDYVVDAIDFLPAKKELIRYCTKNKIPFISSMGMGKRMNPMKVEVMELEKTSYDPIARILRKMVRDEKIREKIYVVCSREIPKKTDEKTVSSSIFVPAVAGLLCANFIVQKVLGE